MGHNVSEAVVWVRWGHRYMGNKKQTVVELTLPFALEHRGYAAREHIVGWDSRKATEYLRALCAEIAANAGEFDDCEVVGVHLGGGIATNAPAEELWAMGRTCMWHPAYP